MAVFKVGQRVRKVSYRISRLPNNLTPVRSPIGSIGTVTAIGDSEYEVCFDGFDYFPFDGAWCAPYMLAPLTDSGCDQFIADMNKFAKLQKSPIQRLKELFGEKS